MINFVELEGSYFEIGKGWGKALRDDMEKVFEIEFETISAMLGVDRNTVVAIGNSYLETAEKYDPDFMEVLKGFSEGAEVDFKTLFALRTVLEVLCQTSRPEGMCTSFAITGNAAYSGEAIIGQNIDWHPELPLVLLKIVWPDGVRQLALSLAGVFEYALTKPPSSAPFGVAATLTATGHPKPGQPTVPVSILMNKASRQHGMKQALAVFSSVELNLASFLLADGTGRVAGIELGLGGYELLEFKEDFLAHANHYQSDRFAPEDILLPFLPDSPLRQKRLTELIKASHGGITVEHMKRFLADHDNHPKGICVHVDPMSDFPPSATIASVIMVPEREVMYVAAGNPCESDYVRFKIGE